MIYLSLAMRDNPNCKEQSEAFEKIYLAQGIEVFNPTKDYTGYTTKEAEYLAIIKDFEILYKCEKMVILPNSENSSGVKLEIAFCQKFNIPYYKAVIVNNKIIEYEYLSKYDLKSYVEELRIQEGYEPKEFYKSRRQEVMDLRHIIAKILIMQGYTLSHIARALKKDHTTIIASNVASSNLLETNIQFRTKYNEIAKKLGFNEYMLNNVAA